MGITEVKKNIEQYFELFNIFPETEVLKDVELGEDSKVILTQNPFFFFNACFNLAPNISLNSIHHLKTLFDQRNIAGSMWLDKSEVSQKSLDLLLENGFLKIQDASIVSCELNPDDFANIKSSDIYLAQDGESLRKWVRAFIEIYGFDIDVTEDFLVKWFLENSERNKTRFINFYMKDGTSVSAIGSLFLSGDFAGLYNLGVPESYRRKGLGDSLTRYMAKYAYESGIRYLGGAGSALGMELYQNFKIKNHGTYSLLAYFPQ